MELNRIPIFKYGKILTKEMLEELKNQGEYFIRSLYELYSEGVIYGINPKILNNKVIIFSGLIKFKDELFKIEKKELEIPLEDGEYIGYLKKIKKEENDNFKELYFEIDVEGKDKFDSENHFELFRILRREGANLKEMSKFDGLNQEYNTLNLIYLKQATQTGENLSKKLLKNYASSMIKNKELRSEEKIVCLYILNSNHEREFILGYLELKDNVNNLDIYKALENRYINTKNKNSKEGEFKYERRRMLVD